MSLSNEEIDVLMATLNLFSENTLNAVFNMVISEYGCPRCTDIRSYQKDMEKCCINCLPIMRINTCSVCNQRCAFYHECTKSFDAYYCYASRSTVCSVCHRKYKTVYNMRKHFKRTHAVSFKRYFYLFVILFNYWTVPIDIFVGVELKN